MQCPQCKTVELISAEEAGVMIDYCPACRGTWLEKGELDTLLRKAGRAAATVPAESPGPYEEVDQGYGEGSYRRRRGGWREWFEWD